MFDLVFWSVLRFLFAAVPLGLAILAGQRAFHSTTANTQVYMVFSGFCAVVGMSILPWALHISGVSIPALGLSALSGVVWICLNRLLGRSLTGYSDPAARTVEPVFRHREWPHSSSLDARWTDSPSVPELPFIPAGPDRQL